MNKTLLSVSTLALVGFSSAAYASHAGKTITSPYVEQGAIEMEAKGGYILNGDEEDSWGSEITAGYGVTSFWEVEAGIVLEDEGRGSDVDAAALVFENKFQLAQPGTFFVDPGLKLEYARSLNGGPDEIGAKFIVAKQLGQFDHVANFSIGREIGEDSSDENEYGFSYGAAYNYRDDLAFGLEWYSDFGNFEEDFEDEGHQIGPVVYGNAFGLEYEAGILAGVSEAAPDAELKLVLGYEF